MSGAWSGPPRAWIDLGGVAVAGHGSVGAHAAGPLGVVGGVARTVAALARSDLELTDHAALAVDEVGFEQRANGEVGGRCVTADSADVLRALDVFPMDLGEAVDEAVEPLWSFVRLAVPAFVVGGVAETEVGRQVDDALGEPRELFDAAHGAAVGQADKEHVAAFELVERAERQLGGAAEVGVGEVDEGAGESLTGHLGNLYLWVAEEQAQQLATGVPGTSDDGRPDHDAAPATVPDSPTCST